MVSYNELPFEIKVMLMEYNSSTFIQMMHADTMLMKYVIDNKNIYFKNHKDILSDLTQITFGYIYSKKIKHGNHQLRFNEYRTIVGTGFIKNTIINYDKIITQYHLGRKLKYCYYLGRFLKYEISGDMKRKIYQKGESMIEEFSNLDHNLVKIYRNYAHVMTIKINNMHQMCTELYHINKKRKLRVTLSDAFVAKISRFKSNFVYEITEYLGDKQSRIETLTCQKGIFEINFYLHIDEDGNTTQYKTRTSLYGKSITDPTSYGKTNFIKKFLLENIHIYDPAGFEIFN